MTRFPRLTHMPITWRVPLAVALLMVSVSAVISERVLYRLGTLQEAYLQSLASAYIDGVTASIAPSVLRQDTWEIFDTLERMQPDAKDITPVETVIATTSNIVLAASNPRVWPSLESVGDEFLDRFPETGINLNSDVALGYQMHNIVYQGQTIGKIFAVFDASPLLEERREIFFALLLTNATLTGLLVLVGFSAVRRMIRPMQILESHMLDAASGHSLPIDAKEYAGMNREAQQVFKAFNVLQQADIDRQNLSRQLAEEEKLASLGRLSSVMAHEINNPLGGLLNAVDTLRIHGEKPKARNASLDLLQRGLEGIAEVVRAALATYRPERHTRPLARTDFEDAKLLLMPELRRRRQHLDCQIALPEDIACAYPSGPIRQATINLLLNASAATPEGGTVGLTVAINQERLIIEVRDQGTGMPRQARAILMGETETSLPPGSGLGLWIVRQIAEEISATIEISGHETSGSSVRISLPENTNKGLHHAA